MSLWPFRTGNDDRFQSSSRAASDKEDIYAAVRHGGLPPHRYGIEVNNYLEWRWRRGFLQSVFPVACYGALAGFCVGFRQSRVEGRYIGRYRIMWRYTSTFAAVGLLTSAFHQLLVMRNQYHDKFYYPIVAGTAGAVVLTLVSQMGSFGQGVFAGSFVGVLYGLGCYGMNYYHRRRLRTFLHEQQMNQVPIHKVSPELQPMYRAFLYDYRPMEEEDKRTREAVTLSRSADDTRLDARTFMSNMTPEVYDWVNFPDWWPLKFPTQTEEEQMLLERQRDEEVERRKVVFLETEDAGLLKRKNRAKQYRDR
ncbi:putative mitochondrial hypothetical protein [Leptomonas pyrrhocoris]|uniref:Transmembrane protein n=1 Tax=Leptomonas pyrrhocoris TaxID=157538 RepID=A0A0M9G4S1_LEPPY|nr:putative mitochondrial hypothetical protein [Leptomonas pyrrhocoris]KPA82253.1 putative mitochondrial hypothetical protein [Leptomonas pyrrhocoris]|eukprot:XP_015660692.1 putative mitochondrial hypothetical protein [Leptomonas pyrrhocoris]